MNGEVFYRLRDAEILNAQWRKHYNTKRPLSALPDVGGNPDPHRCLWLPHCRRHAHHADLTRSLSVKGEAGSSPDLCDKAAEQSGHPEPLHPPPGSASGRGPWLSCPFRV
ncbi:hypothetical protein [Phaeobacter gallaeciensis]|uniref:hypothetical protein n=1 Tax=Phaeobacter gallaeciensis TaxID=60890 RepID=UPI003CD01FEF